MILKSQIKSLRNIQRRKYQEAVKREERHSSSLSSDIMKLRNSFARVIFSEYPNWEDLSSKTLVNGKVEEAFNQSRHDFKELLLDDFYRNPLFYLDIYDSPGNSYQNQVLNFKHN